MPKSCFQFPDPDHLQAAHDPGPSTVPKITSSHDFRFLNDRFGINMGGQTLARSGNHFARLPSEFSQVLVSCRGLGYGLIDGIWVELTPGTAYITPMGQPHAYLAAPDTEWEFSWVIYRGFGPADLEPFLQREAPYIAQVDPNLLSFPPQGLHNESIHNQDELMMLSWAQLAHGYIRRALAGDDLDPRLRRLWLNVQEHLSEPWDCRQMARIASMSEEHLRRLCQSAYGQSPMRRLSTIRIRHVADLLAYSNLSLEQIAETMGYSDASALSRSFKHHQGLSPSHYRKNIRQRTDSIQRE